MAVICPFFSHGARFLFGFSAEADSMTVVMCQRDIGATYIMTSFAGFWSKTSFVRTKEVLWEQIEPVCCPLQSVHVIQGLGHM